MYDNRAHVRDIESKVRVNQIEDTQAEDVCQFYGKQRATYFHDCIAEILERDHKAMLAEKNNIRRG